MNGAEIEFVADEPTQPFQSGWEIAVEMPDNSRQTLVAEPDQGPTHVGWRTKDGQYWIFPLVRTRPGSWLVQFERQHKELQEMEAKRRP